MDYLKDVRSFVASNLLFGDTDSFQNETSFLESGVIDSMGILELITFVEKTYGIKVEPEEMVPENFDSVNKLAFFLSKKAAKSVPN
jgi:acyl carrier protein